VPAVLASKLSGSHDHEVNLPLLGRNGLLELGPAEDVFSPITDAVSVGFQSLTEIVGGLEPGAELDGLENLELGGSVRWTETREKLLQCRWIFDLTLHHVFRRLGQIFHNCRRKLKNL